MGPPGFEPESMAPEATRIPSYPTGPQNHPNGYPNKYFNGEESSPLLPVPDDVAAGLAPDGVVRTLLFAYSAEHSVRLQGKSWLRFIKGSINGFRAQGVWNISVKELKKFITKKSEK